MTERCAASVRFRWLAVSILAALICGALVYRASGESPEAQPAQTIAVDGSDQGPIFDGLGAVSAGASSRLLIDYPEPERSQILDYLFKPGYGASLQHLKVEIGGDENSTDGSEPSSMRSPEDHNYDRGYEWWLMTEARKRNPKIVLDTLAWGAPGWVGSGRLYSRDMANYVADFLEGAKKAHGLDIAYTGVWNEKVYDAAYVKMLDQVLKARWLSTQIVCCDEYPGEGGDQWQVIEAMAKDPVLKDAIAAVTVHYPWVYNNTTTPPAARTLSKPLWSSEDQPNSGGGPIVSRDWEVGGRLLAKLYNRNYLEGGFTSTEIWSPVTSYYDILAAPNSGLMYANTPWSGHYDVQGAIWATAHTTQFAQPGWHYADPSCGHLVHGGSFVTFLSPDGGQWSTVIESIDARKPQTVRLHLAGAFSGQAVHVWETNSSVTFQHVRDVMPAHGWITLEIAPDSLYSITNTAGQGRGDAQPPAAAGFPLPYADSFDASPVGRAAKYLSDQDGAFEVHPCRERAGNCLTQVITVKPIPWFPLPDPFTLAGDESWTDYTVAADALIPQAGQATVFGRIDSANVFADRKAIDPSGYGLILRSSGSWQLISTDYKKPEIVLASGEIEQQANQWHHLQLSFDHARVGVTIDGRRLAQVEDSSHAHGMFAVGSDWTRVQFDNLSVTPAGQQGHE
ncbi:MAG: galactosylceramidase [Acidobacteriota bacterium]